MIDCPTAERLAEFSIGNLNNELINQVAEHIESCPGCAARLAEFDSVSDEVTQVLGDMNPDLQGNTNSERLLDPGTYFASQLEKGVFQLGKFQLTQLIGSGSYGHVFRAHDTELDRIVALKILRAGSLAPDEQIQRFNREARNTARLDHSNIVTVFEVGQTDDGICLMASQYIDGQTLEQLLKSGPLDPKQAANFLIAIARALQYAHEQKVIHRDIKPSNIIVDLENQVHLMDFGLAKQLKVDETVTGAGQVMGTPFYMPPEQIEGKTVDGRADIYSLGVVMYEMLTGHRPFEGQKQLLLLQVLEDEPRPPRQLVSSIPRDMQVICQKALEKLPRSRYQTAGEMADDLQRFVDGLPIQARPAGPIKRLWTYCRQYPFAAASFAAVLMVGAVGAIYLSLLSRYFVRQTALDSAAMQSKMLDTINECYSDAVDRSSETASSGMPVPARFTIEVGNRLQDTKSGMQVRLYSDYPFLSRKDGGVPDAFGRRALDDLIENPNEPVYEFTEMNDHRVVRFATARIMSASCIECHNYHPESPKTDWKVGDVRGVLEIIRPLEQDIQRTERGLGNVLAWMGIISAILLGVGVATVLYGKKSR